MLERAKGQFTIEGNVEEIFGGIAGAARIARISQSCRFSGELEGESMAEFTAMLPREGDGRFHGFQRISGTLGEREGTFVMSVTGEIQKGQPRGSWAIVPKSGSGDFVHIRGDGTFSLPDGKPGTYRLEFDLRKPRAAKATTAEAVAVTPDVAIEEATETPAESIEAPVAAPEKRTRKPRARKAEPLAEVVVDAPVKRTRTRMAKSVSAEPVVAAEQPAKRTRSTKSETATSTTAVVAEPPTKRARRRQTESAAPAEVIAEPTPKPKRSRKASQKDPATEPEAAAAGAPQEIVPIKPHRRKKPAPPEPVVLPVAERTAPRRRRAKAA